MCVLALWIRKRRGTPLIVAANRDEYFDRPSEPLQKLGPGIVGGRDLRGGGTWLGVNRQGILVAVTNRGRPAPAGERYSRGLLALEALRRGALREIHKLVEKRTRLRPMAGFNLVAVREGMGLALHFDGALRPTPFGPGAHVISTDEDLDDLGTPERAVFKKFARSIRGAPDEVALRDFLSSHAGKRPVCKHGARFGTVSSTIYIRHTRNPILLHAEGPPCRTPFDDYSHLLP